MAVSAPSASVVIPVFNREALLRECLESVRHQSLGEWECIVVDDGSTDGSVRAALEYQARDARFRVLSRPSAKRGAAACRNIGVEASNGRYIVFLDSDDLLHPECLAGRITFLAAYGGTLDFAVFPTLTFRQRPGDSDILWNIDKPIPDLLRFLRLDVPWSITGSIWKAESVKAIGGFDEGLPGWQDWQIHTVALLEGLRFERPPSLPDCYVRRHEGTKISAAAAQVSHIDPKANYLLALMQKYRGQILASDSSRCAAVGLMWFLIVQLERAGRLPAALRLWWRTWRMNYIDGRILREGAIALIMHGKPGGSLAWAALGRWPEDIAHSIDTSTCHTVKLSLLSERSAVEATG